MERSVLITNLLDVSIPTLTGNVRMHTNALVLFDSGPGRAGPRYRLHGFQNEAGNLTFDMVLPSFKWTIDPLAVRADVITRHFVLTFTGTDLRIELYTDFANDLPLDIESFEGQHDWSSLLLRKVLRYYHAPYIMLGQQHDIAHVRDIFGVKGASP